MSPAASWSLIGMVAVLAAYIGWCVFRWEDGQSRRGGGGILNDSIPEPSQPCWLDELWPEDAVPTGPALTHTFTNPEAAERFWQPLYDQEDE